MVTGANPRPKASAIPPKFADLIFLWAVKIPKILDAWAPTLADAFADDSNLATWPNLAAWVPLVALAVGLLLPWLITDIYTESVLFLIFATVGATWNWSVGPMLLAGYVVADVIREVGEKVFDRMATSSAAGHVVAYLLLAILVVRMPQFARELANGLQEYALRDNLLPSQPRLRELIDTGVYAAIAGGLVFLWCQATIVLIRPVFTWAQNSPTDAAVMQVQVRWRLLVAFAMIGAGARAYLKYLWPPTCENGVATTLQQRRSEGAVQGGPVWQKLPTVVRITVTAVIVTFLLSGTYSGVIDALLMLIVTLAVGAWRAGLIGKLPSAWAERVEKVPVLARIAAATAAGYVVSAVLLSIFWTSGSLRPVMIGALLTVVAFYALLVPSSEGEDETS